MQVDGHAKARPYSVATRLRLYNPACFPLGEIILLFSIKQFHFFLVYFKKTL